MLRAVLLAVVLAVRAVSAHAASVAVGDPAPAFSLTGRDGRPVALADLRGRVVCLDFWATWCATCKTALPALDALARRPGFENVRFLAVNIDREAEPSERFVAQNLPGTKLTLLRDAGGALLARFGADGMPALYLIDERGVVRHVEAGYETSALTRVERVLDGLVGARR
jgi:cytochrome c biogenesis protein CcmG/thiol:disulfide interchange protein DsbE